MVVRSWVAMHIRGSIGVRKLTFLDDGHWRAVLPC
jgi:hypothetical protein